MRFDPSDPFPLIDNLSVDYEVVKKHAAQVDEWLGLQTESTERAIVSNGDLQSSLRASVEGRREFWVGKSVQTFSTPYTELRMMLEDVRHEAHDTIVDLGSGYGRMAHVVARHFPGTIFRGFEMVRERHEEAKRVIRLQRLKDAFVECGDVTKIDLASLESNLFFLYDFGSREDVETLAENLKILGSCKKLTVIARGGRSRDIIEKRHPWLSQVVRPEHRGHYSIFRSAE